MPWQGLRRIRWCRLFASSWTSSSPCFGVNRANPVGKLFVGRLALKGEQFGINYRLTTRISCQRGDQCTIFIRKNKGVTSCVLPGTRPLTAIFVREIISVCFSLSARVKPLHLVLKFKISVILIALTKRRFEAAWDKKNDCKLIWLKFLKAPLL